MSRLSCLALFTLLGAGCQQKPAAASAPVPAAAPPLAAKAAAGAREETSEFVVSLSAKAAGGTVFIAAKPPLHINPEYPTAFKPEGAGVKFEGEKVALAPDTKKPCEGKAEDTCETTSLLKYQGAVGDAVAGTLQFSVCMPDKCLIEKVKLATAVEP